MSRNRITILHDSFGKRADLTKDWGFAALVEFAGKRILFDTGNNARTFAQNTEALGVDLRKLDFAAISHRHGDHTSGLNHLFKLNPGITVYTPDETYGVFGSSLPGIFYPRCHSLPAYMQYYDGQPPETIRHGTPWPEAKFVWVKETTEIAQDVWLVAVVSDMPGTREMRELSLALRTPRGLVLVAGCSHPGIENILAASRAVYDHLYCIFGGLHLVLTKEPEIRRIANALREQWRVDQIAPGHCTGEPAFLALSEAFGERYICAGLGDTIDLP
ncbi:MAG: MBL fold metallo-hydrolase [Nitrospirae bacterium]|nr:MBL fold metallo-hydrolase [Nitrospirota bacterium]MBI3351581.1 MBL fold metallo-hydrolase [Nitrospirota bacterium]